MGCGSSPGVLEVQYSDELLVCPVGQEVASELELTNVGENELVVLDVVFQERPALVEGPQYTIHPDVSNLGLEGGESVVLDVIFSPLKVDVSEVDVTISTTVGNRVMAFAGEGQNNLPEVAFELGLPEEVCQGDGFRVEATVSDVEDGVDLSAVQAILESSLEGALLRDTFAANGTLAVSIVLETPGGHELTLSATDGDGGTSSVSSGIVVTPLVDLEQEPACQ